MATIRLHQTTTATPEQFLAGVTDFGPGRSKIFPNSADGYLKMHSQAPGQADVTEGSNGIWERLHYDWSDPHRITMTTTDSNVWGGRSGHTYTLTQRSDGGTDVDVVAVREGKNLKGRLLGSWWGPSARASWRRLLRTPSRPSNPGTQKEADHELFTVGSPHRPQRGLRHYGHVRFGRTCSARSAPYRLSLSDRFSQTRTTASGQFAKSLIGQELTFVKRATKGDYRLHCA